MYVICVVWSENYRTPILLTSKGLPVFLLPSGVEEGAVGAHFIIGRVAVQQMLFFKGPPVMLLFIQLETEQVNTIRKNTKEDTGY